MCVISVLPKGKEKHTDEVDKFITSGYHSNTQGSGFMWKKNGTNKVGISKGYFNLDSLLKEYNKMKFSVDDEVVVHHRIGTSGAKDGANTHPFYIHSNINECTKTEGLEDLVAVCHNGVFGHSKISKYMTTGYSDTVAFANKYMTQPGLIDLLISNPNTFEAVTDDFVDGDKLCFLFPNRDLVMIGNYIEDNGYYHSNTGYKRYTHNVGGVEYPTHSYGNYSNYYTRSLFNDEYDNWYNKPKTTTKAEPIIRDNKFSMRDIDDLFLEKISSLDYESYCMDSEYLGLNSGNYKNFWLTPKKTSMIYGASFGDLFEIIDFEQTTTSFAGPVLTTIRSKENQKRCLGFKLSYIEEKFNFFPKKLFVESYKHFLYLCIINPNISNKKLKAIHKKLSDEYEKSDLSSITIGNQSFTKLAWLELYNQNCHKLSDLYTLIDQTVSADDDNQIICSFTDNVCTLVKK